MCFEGGGFIFSFTLWTDSSESPRGVRERFEGELLQHTAVAEVQVQGPMGAWALWTLELLFCKCQSMLTVAAELECLGFRLSKLFLAVSFPCGGKLTNRTAAAWWRISIWWLCAVGHGWVPFRCSVCKWPVFIGVEFCVVFLKSLDCLWIYFGALMVD